MIGYWISFAIIFILIPIGIFNLKNWSLKDKNITEVQKKNANAVMTKYTLFYWLCDLFYMSCFINNLTCKFVFGGLVMAIILMSVSLSVSYPKVKTIFEKWSLLQDFIVGVGISIYLIYLIPDKTLQTIVIAIVSAIYGGLITLVGVSWTIKKSDEDRKNDEVNRVKPLFNFYNISSKDELESIKHRVYSSLEWSDSYLFTCVFCIENSYKSIIRISKVFHDGIFEDFKGNLVILPQESCSVKINFKVPKVFIAIFDELGKEHYYKLVILDKINPNDSLKKTIEFNYYLLNEIVEVNQEEVNNSNSKNDEDINEEVK